MSQGHADVLRTIDPAGIADPTLRARFAEWSDADLTDAVASVVAVPRVGEPDSFILHAPLEVLARTALLPHVHPAQRETARSRLVWMAATYAGAAEGVDARPSAPHTDGQRVIDAIAAGELDDAAALGHGLALALDAEALATALADAIVPSLAAAAHGSIFLYLLPRVAPRSELAASMVGALCREVARNVGLHLSWHDTPRAADTDVQGLEAALRATPLLGSPGSNFIFPLIHQVESTGTAAALIGPHVGAVVEDIAELRRAILRVAATSMIVDDPDQSPYGWSHTMTIAQAVSGVAGLTADPASALAIAATHVAGFRAGLGTRTLEGVDPLPTAGAADDVELPELLDAGPAVAAASVAGRRFDDPALITVLASNAACHPDAHLAKYTLACLDARRSDPDHGSLYLAAAAHLGAWWRQVPLPDDPLLG